MSAMESVVEKNPHQDKLESIFGHDGLEKAYQEAADLIRNHQSFLVTGHFQPDGDAFGSTMALCHLLWSLGKEAVPFNVDEPPFNFVFLDRSDEIQHTLDPSRRFDCTIVLDCAQKHRVGASFPDNGWGEKILVIDHHQTWDDDFADVYVRDTGAAAVGEMIFRLGLVMGIELSRSFADCCHASLVSDTGGFRYSKTSATTFKIASALIEAGVSPWHINSNIYENEPIERVRFLSKVLNTLELSPCGRLAFLYIRDDMLQETGISPDLVDGFINYARRIQGVEVATQLREIGPDQYKISFRSRGNVNVASLAEAFGGGGHHNAAGCAMEGDASEIQNLLTQQLNALL